MRIEQLMRFDPTRVGPDEPIENIIRWYANPGNRSRYTYVVDKDGVLLGVVTMMELLGQFMTPELVASHEKSALAEDQVLDQLRCNLDARKAVPLREIMRRDLPTVRPGDFFLEARLLLRERKITALPVVNAQGVLVGEMTRRTLMALLEKLLREPDLFTLKKDCKNLFDSGSEVFIG
jgi:CBS domain-containing protein